MFTVGLALAESFGKSKFGGLYVATFLLDGYLLEILGEYILK